jgi:hypothetical protein
MPNDLEPGSVNPSSPTDPPQGPGGSATPTPQSNPSAPSPSHRAASRWHVRLMLSWTAGVTAMICAMMGAAFMLIRGENGLNLGLFLACLAAFLLIVWFFLVFAAELETDDPNGGVRVNEMVAFCYSVALCMLGASALGPIAFFQSIQINQNVIERNLRLYRQEGKPTEPQINFDKLQAELETQAVTNKTIWPIAILPACAEAPNDSSWELSCSRQRRQPDQWIVNIGGYVTSRLPDTVQQLKWQYAMQGKPAPDALPAAASTSATPSPGTQKIAADQPDPPTPAVDSVFSDPTMLSEVVYQSVGAYQKWPLFMVHGGLSVPWYVIMLAVMGASVSMIRRVPEYQMQADGVCGGDNTGTSAKAKGKLEPISKGEAREKMVFEVLQLVAAPMIAIVAYNAFTPSDRSGTVLLGFASGFSSEPLLIAIRAGVDRLVISLKGAGASSAGDADKKKEQKTDGAGAGAT